MSREVETRVVEMEFKYDEFKRGIADAVKMLDLLKKSLDFNDATNSLNELIKITKNFNTDQMVKQMEQLSQAKKGLNFDELARSATSGLTTITNGLGKVVTNGFDLAATALSSLKSKIEFSKEEKAFNRLADSALTVDLSPILEGLDFIAQRVSFVDNLFDQWFINIINKGLDAGKRLVSSMTIDQVSAGWGKYGEKVASVQTIMNATGDDIDRVNEYLAELMWFSDETSYGFTDMTQALGMMASSGGDVKNLIPLITGVANATAFAGKGAAEFSRIMYNLNQSYSHGSLQLMDWKSVELAGAASQQLKQALIDAAVELGIIDEGAVTFANFSESLKDGWATTEVMEKAFGRFAEASTEAYKLVQEGLFDTASEAYDYLEGKMDGFAIKAAKSAQEAKTFGEAISATQDAVSSGWLESYEIIFGNYEEAKKLWTDLANTLWDAFAAGGEARNAMLDDWVHYGGKTQALKALANIWDVVVTLIGDAKEGFHDVFGYLDGLSLSRITNSFTNFTKTIKDLVEGTDSFKRTFRGISSVLGIGKLAIKAVWKVLSNLVSSNRDAIESFLNFTATISDYIYELYKALDGSEELSNFFEDLTKTLNNVADKIKSILGKIKDAFLTLPAFFAKNAADIASQKTGLEKLHATFADQFKAFEKLFEKIKNGFTYVGTLIKDGFLTVKEQIIKILDSISFNDVKNAGVVGLLSSFVLYLSTFIKNSKKPFSEWKFTFGQTEVVDAVTSFFGTIKSAFAEAKNSLKIVTRDISETLEAVRGSLVLWQNSIRAQTLLTIAKAVGVLTLSILGLSSIDPQKLASSLSGLGIVFAESFGMLSGLSKLSGDKNNIKMISTLGPALIEIGAAMVVLAQAVKSLSVLNFDEIVRGVFAISAILGSVLGVAKVFDGVNLKGIGLQLIVISAAMNVMTLAIKSLGQSMSKTELEQGLSSVTGLVITLGAFLKFVSKTELGIGTAVAVLGIAAAIVVLAEACKILTTVPQDMLYDTLGGIVMILGGIALLSKFMGDKSILSLFSKTPIGPKTGIGLIALAGAIAILADSCAKLSVIPMDALFNAELAMAALFTMVGVFSTIMQDTKKMITSAIAVGIISAAIYGFSQSLQSLKELSVDQLVASVVALGAIFFEVGAFLKLLPKNALISALNMTTIGGALYLLAQPFLQLAQLNLDSAVVAIVALGGLLAEVAAFLLIPLNIKQAVGNATSLALMVVSVLGIAEALQKVSVAFGTNWEQVGVALTAIAGSLLILGVAAKSMQGSLKGASVVAVLAASLLTLVPVLTVLSAMPISVIGVGLIALAAAFGVIGVAAKLMQPLLPAIAGLAGSILLLGASVTAVGFGLSYFSAELTALGLSIAATVGSGAELIATVIKLIPEFVVKLAEGFFEVLKMIPENGPAVFAAISTVLTGIIEAIITAIPYVIDAAGRFVISFLEGLAKNLPLILELGIQIIMALLKGINDHIYEVTEVVLQLLANFILAVANGLPMIIAAATMLILQFIHGMKVAVEEHMEEIVTEIMELGVAICEGLAKGIINGLGSVATSIMDLGNHIVDKFKEFFDIHSPSGVFEAFGINLDEGLSLGIEGGSDEPLNAMGSLGDDLKDMLSKYTDQIPGDGSTMMKGLTDAIFSETPDVTDSMDSTIASTLKVVSDSSPNFQKEGVNNMQALIDGFKSQTYNATTTIASIMQSLVSEIARRKPSFYDQGKALVENLRTGIASSRSLPISEVRSMVSDALDKVSLYIDDFYSVGQDIVDGFVSGMRSKIYRAAAAAAEIAREAYEAAMEEVDAHSPSRKFYQLGVWIDEGLVNGINDYASFATNATSRMSKDVLDEFTDVITSISQVVDSELDTAPVIRPVVDLEEVWKARDAIGEIQAGVQNEPIQLFKSIELPERIARDFASREQANEIQNGSETAPTSQSFTFNQNNYSPKELSRLDIYRQTRNQFRQFREEMERA